MSDNFQLLSDNFQLLSDNFQLLSDNFQLLSDNFQLLSDNFLPSKKVSYNFLPSALKPTFNQKCLTTYGSPQL